MSNISVGYRAGKKGGLGGFDYNVFLGVRAGEESNSGFGIVSIGFESGMTVSKEESVFVGAFAGKG